MCKLAEPGAVLCAAPLAARLRAAAAADPGRGARLRCAPRGVFDVKGKGPMEIIRVSLQPVARSGPRPAPRRGVGRGLDLPLCSRNPFSASRRRLSILDFFTRESAEPAAVAGAPVCGYLSPEGRAWMREPAHLIGPDLAFRDAK